MKKFLSLVLALIMAMSLVTIGAGAVSYDELTDKDEISSDREEAVAVLNAISIIGGYPDGSYKPQGALTRQVAAKFIVSLLIGPDAAENLTAVTAPYPDVPTSSQFAGYISYCKTANIISGYSDGTFRPEGSLTGYAFAKMLLGALGYRGDIEGFTGTGWTMNVAKIGNAANLFDRLQFQGGETLNREDAAQLCLNTLKATMVEYSGGFNITAGDATVTGAQTRSYVTSNQEYARYIDNRKVTFTGTNNSTNDVYTVEFGEEHFKDLRLNDEHSYGLGGARDDFGRPANHWSWKKVTIGNFAIEPDFVYTEQMAVKDSKPSEAAKVRALGLGGYEVNSSTILTINGKDYTNLYGTAAGKKSVGSIADLTDNGVEVEVYVSEDKADMIANVVVIYTQLMQVRKVSAESVSLKLYKDKGGVEATNQDSDGFNRKPFDKQADGATLSRLEDVDVNNECFEFLSGLKADDKVAIIPVTTDNGQTYSVAGAYVPEKVTGALTGAKNYSNTTADPDERIAIEVTVGGTTYKVANWNYELQGITQNVLKVTKKDVTLYLDRFGYAMLAEDVGSTSDFFILGAWRNQIVNNTIVRVATGWDIKGNAVELNVGSEKSGAVDAYEKYKPGDLLRYFTTSTVSNADWALDEAGVYTVNKNQPTGTTNYAIRASNATVTLEEKGDTLDKAFGRTNPQVSSSVKVIYVAFEGNEVDYIEIKNGLQNITTTEIERRNPADTHAAQAALSVTSAGALKKEGTVDAIVIKSESKDATIKNVGYVYDFHANIEKDENGNWVAAYNVYTQDGDNVTMKSTNNIGNRKFVRYTELENGYYRLTLLNTDAGSGVLPEIGAMLYRTAEAGQTDDYRFVLDGQLAFDGITRLATLTTGPNKTPNIYTSKNPGYVDLTSGDSYKGMISVYGAKIMDLRTNAKNKVTTAKELKALVTGDKTSDVPSGTNGNTLMVDVVYNDNPESDGFRTAYYLIIRDITGVGSSANYSNGVLKNTVYPYKSGSNGFTTGSGSAGTEGEPPATGDNKYVKFASGLTEGTKDGQIGSIASSSQVKIESSGNTTIGFTLTIPEWAAPVNGTYTAGTTGIKVSYNVLRDGKLWDANKTVESQAFTSSSTALLKPNSDGSAPTTDPIKTYKVEALPVVSGWSTVSDIVGHDITIEITAIDYGFVKVQYLDQNGDPVITGGSSQTDKLKTAKGGTIALQNTVNTTVYSNHAAVDISFVNVLNDSDGKLASKMPKANTGNSIDKSTNVHADNVGYAKVLMTLTKASSKLNLTTEVYDSGKTSMILGSDGNGSNSDTTLDEYFATVSGAPSATAGLTTTKLGVTIAEVIGAGSFNPASGNDLTHKAQAYGVLTSGDTYKLTFSVYGGDSGHYIKYGMVVEEEGKDAVTYWYAGSNTATTDATKATKASLAGTTTVSAVIKPTANVKIDFVAEYVEAPEIKSATATKNDDDSWTIVFNMNCNLDGAGKPEWIAMDKSGTTMSLLADKGVQKTPSADGQTCTVTFVLSTLEQGKMFGFTHTANNAATVDGTAISADSTEIGVTVTSVSGSTAVLTPAKNLDFVD